MARNKKAREHAAYYPLKPKNNPHDRARAPLFVFQPEPRYGIKFSLLMLLGLITSIGSMLASTEHPLTIGRESVFSGGDDYFELPQTFYAEDKNHHYQPTFFGAQRLESINRHHDKKICESVAPKSGCR